MSTNLSTMPIARVAEDIAYSAVGVQGECIVPAGTSVRLACNLPAEDDTHYFWVDPWEGIEGYAQKLIESGVGILLTDYEVKLGTVTSCRKPTPAEVKFGHGCPIHCEIPADVWLRRGENGLKTKVKWEGYWWTRA